MAIELHRALLAEAVEVFRPLTDAAESPQVVESLLAAMGWDLDPVVGMSPSDVATAASAVQEAVDQAVVLLEAGVDDLEDLALGLGMMAAAAAQLAEAAAGWRPPADLDPGVVPTLLGDLLLFLLDTRLREHTPRLRGVLELLGIFSLTSAPGIEFGGRKVRAARRRPRLDLGAAGRALTDPIGLLHDRYAANPDPDAIADAVGPLLASALTDAGVHAVYGTPGAATAPGVTDAERAAAARLLHIMLTYQGDEPDDPAAAGTDAGTLIVVLGLTRTPDDQLVLIISPSGTFSLSRTEDTWTLRAGVTGPLGALAVRGDGVEWLQPQPGAGIQVTTSLDRPPAAGNPLLRLGSASGTHFEVRGATVGVGFDFASEGADVHLSLALSQTELAISAGDGDGFLSNVLPAEPIIVDLAIGLDWSPRRGLHVNGGAGLMLDLPLDIVLGPVRATGLSLALRANAEGLSVEAGITAGLKLGPFSASVAGIGIQGRLMPAEAGGSLGPIDFRTGFKPPVGAGLAIKTPAISGGGFLRLESDRYTGVFELTIVNTVSVKVIGIITTRLPDGSPGFALLLMITAEGFTPIQLGMGFVLTGIGGLIALNRTIDVEAVRGGLSSGVLDSVLFAKDPVANADRIIATLETIFPLAPDRLLIGPLAEIGWGSPTVVKVRLALLLEIPQPVRVVLLAALALALPDEDAPVVELHVDAIGVLDLGRGELALDASLHHSRLWKFALTGDLALRLNWGDDPLFLLSVGGFHPAFTPPAGLRRLERLTFSLSDSENPLIRFETYLAVTSNTIQLGARVSVRLEVGGFGVDGGGAFDALVQWVPFGLDVRFEAWIRIFSGAGTLCAARLALQVTGPQPWHVVGVASLQVLMFQVQVAVDFHVGDPLEPVTVESVDVVELLWDELSRPGSWTSALPAGRTSGATLGAKAADPAAGQPFLVHPLDALSVRQKVVPLGIPVTRIGALRPKAGPGSYDLDVESQTGIAAVPLLDRFAAAQFTDLTEDDKLSAPSFVSWAAGLSFAPTVDGLPTGRAVSSELEFETLDMTSLEQPAVPSGGSAPGIHEELPAPAGPTSWAGLTVVHP